MHKNIIIADETKGTDVGTALVNQKLGSCCKKTWKLRNFQPHRRSRNISVSGAESVVKLYNNKCSIVKFCNNKCSVVKFCNNKCSVVKFCNNKCSVVKYNFK